MLLEENKNRLPYKDTSGEGGNYITLVKKQRILCHIAKRASVIFANHYMIAKGQGLIVIPESHVPEFKRLLVAYYEDRDHGEIVDFMRNKCWRAF